MKQRFISFLLSAVMLLTMLPVTAFAADADTPEIEVYFYADGYMADREATSLRRQLRVPSNTETTGNKADTMIVVCRNLNANQNYTLTLSYPDEIGFNKKNDKNKEILSYTSGDDTIWMRKIGEIISDPSNNNQIDMLTCVSLDMGNVLTNYGKPSEAKYIVHLYKGSLSNIDDNIENNAAAEQVEVNLKKIKVDFGTLADPRSIIDSEGSEGFYDTIAINDQNGAGKTAALFYANEEELKFNSESTDNEIRAYFDDLFRFLDTQDVDDAYQKTREKGWQYDELTSTFSWRTNLMAGDISAAPLEDIQTGEHHVDKLYKENTYKALVKDKKDNEALSVVSTNTVNISAEDLVKHWMVDKWGAQRQGDWVGFSIDVPDDAETIKFWSATSKDELESEIQKQDNQQSDNLDEEKEIYSFYVDRSASNQQTWHALQFYGSDKVPVTSQYIFEMNLDGVLPTSAYVITSKTEYRDTTIAEVPDGIVKKLTDNVANETEKKIVIEASEIAMVRDEKVDPATISSSSVIFTHTDITAAQNGSVTMEIRTPIGTIELPANALPQGSKRDIEVVVKRIARDSVLSSGMVIDDVELERIQMDTVGVEVYKDDTRSSFGSSEDIKLTVELYNIAYPSSGKVEDKILDLLTFEKTKRTNPTILKRNAERIDGDNGYEVEKNKITFGVPNTELYYSIAQRTYVDMMKTIDDRFILITPSPQGFNFSRDVKNYNIETTERALKIKTCEGARLVSGTNSTLIESDKLEWTQSLDESNTKIQIKIGPDVYTLNIVRRLDTADKLELKHDFSLKGLDKITITNAKKGRLYYIQANPVKPNTNPNSTAAWEAVGGASYTLAKKVTDSDQVVFYVSASSGSVGSTDRRILLNIWEISQDETEALIMQNGKLVPNHDPSKDRRVENLQIIRSELE